MVECVAGVLVHFVRCIVEPVTERLPNQLKTWIFEPPGNSHVVDVSSASMGIGGKSSFFSGLNVSMILCAWFQGKARRF